MTTSTVTSDRSWRRFFRFRLRTLLLVMLVIAVPLAWKVNQVHRQRAAVAAIEKLGGSAHWASKLKRDEPPGPAWLRSWLGDDFFDHVGRVIYKSGPKARHILIHVPQFPRLSSLWLYADDTSVTNEDLNALRACPELEELWLHCRHVNGRGLVTIAELTRLESLDLHGTTIDDADLAHLANRTKLRYLSLSSTQVRGPGLVSLRGLKQLEELYLTGHAGTGEGLESLVSLPKLRILCFGRTEIGDEGVTRLNELVGLRSLNLDRTRMTDAGLDKLTGLTNLMYLNLEYTDVTDAGVARLRARLPSIIHVSRSKDGYSPP